MGGGTANLPPKERALEGPSPRGRGNRHLKPTNLGRGGDHPRVGGGTEQMRDHSDLAAGPSPRGRGNQARPIQSIAASGTIPAWAGEPPPEWQGLCRARDHPRVGGGTCASRNQRLCIGGPSPRGRGNLCFCRFRTVRAGTIPAWAGEPHKWRKAPVFRWDHPRVGGGTIHGGFEKTQMQGPSPRGRGNHRAVCCQPSLRGTIPAWAGEPVGNARRGGVLWDHPRVGGGTDLESQTPDGNWGPSPRGRGNLVAALAKAPTTGTIPAWAGEPKCRTF